MRKPLRKAHYGTTCPGLGHEESSPSARLDFPRRHEDDYLGFGLEGALVMQSQIQDKTCQTDLYVETWISDLVNDIEAKARGLEFF
jgi:hypothetical protein